MTKISRRLEQIVSHELSKNIIPIKTEEGILVGDVLIINDHSVKHIRQNNKFLYKDINLNITAIAIANMIAMKQLVHKIDELYKADQDYGRWFFESQFLRQKYQKAVINQDHDRADTLWARYSEYRDRAQQAKKRVECLAVF